MTLDEFLIRLKSIRDRVDEWKLVMDTGSITNRRVKPRFQLRAVVQQESVKGGIIILDPLGALCYVFTGAIYSPDEWKYCGEALEMAPTSAADICAASNDQTWEGVSGERRPVPRLQELRDRLLQAVGLSD